MGGGGGADKAGNYVGAVQNTIEWFKLLIEK